MKLKIRKNLNREVLQRKYFVFLGDEQWKQSNDHVVDLICDIKLQWKGLLMH